MYAEDAKIRQIEEECIMYTISVGVKRIQLSKALGGCSAYDIF